MVVSITEIGVKKPNDLKKIIKLNEKIQEFKELCQLINSERRKLLEKKNPENKSKPKTKKMETLKKATKNELQTPKPKVAVKKEEKIKSIKTERESET